MRFLRSQGERALELEIEGQKYRFDSPAVFEFALRGRTSLPPTKIAALVDLSDEALLQEAEGIRQVEKLFADALSGSLENVTSISPFLKEIDLSLISHDHGWRQIISALNASDEPHERYKKLALVRYMQYLTARQDVIKSLFVNRHKGKKGSEKSAEKPGADRIKDTLIFDVTALADPGDQRSESLVRAPKGETVEIPLEPDEPVAIQLAKNSCRLLPGDPVSFRDPSGRETALRPGRNVVGRDSGADVVIDADLRDVSRKHLVLEVEGKDLVRLTDISSHGTHLPPRYLESTNV